MGSGCFVFGGFEVGVGLGMFELCEVVMIGTNELVLTEFTCEITDSLTVGLTGSRKELHKCIIQQNLLHQLLFTQLLESFTE